MVIMEMMAKSRPMQERILGCCAHNFKFLERVRIHQESGRPLDRIPLKRGYETDYAHVRDYLAYVETIDVERISKELKERRVRVYTAVATVLDRCTKMQSVSAEERARLVAYWTEMRSNTVHMMTVCKDLVQLDVESEKGLAQCLTEMAMAMEEPPPAPTPPPAHILPTPSIPATPSIPPPAGTLGPNGEKKSLGTCTMCHSAEITVAFVKCGHTIACASCAQQRLKEGYCPRCNGAIESVLTVSVG